MASFKSLKLLRSSSSSRIIRAAAVGYRISSRMDNSSRGLQDPTPAMPQMELNYTKQACDARRDWIEKFTGNKLSNIATWWPESCDYTSENLTENIENPIGLASIPLAMAGPMLFKGSHAEGWILGPVATTEGALIASICRGAKAINMSGGIRTWATQQRMSSAPVHVCATPTEALKLGEWIKDNKVRIQEEVIDKLFRNVKLKEVVTAYDLDACHSLLRFETGDCDGQKIAQECSREVARWVTDNATAELNVDIRFFSAEGNLSGERGATSFNALLGRGVSVTAVADIPEVVLQQILGIDSETLHNATYYSHRISERIGQQAGFNVNIANVLGSMFTALGQDIACLHESAVSRVDFTKRDDDEGGVRATMYIPSLVVGSIGGGTSLPTQRECLEAIGCYGEGKGRKLAEVIAGYCLALDLSTYSAVCGGHFADAHDRLGRNRPEDK